jgi:hypothetical protein
MDIKQPVVMTSSDDVNSVVMGSVEPVPYFGHLAAIR